MSNSFTVIELTVVQTEWDTALSCNSREAG